MLPKLSNSPIILLIKILSVFLITSALVLELWNIYQPLYNEATPHIVNLIFWFGRFALISHLLEALIASFYAKSRNKTSFKYAIYTFFIGTIALLELFNRIETAEEN